MDDSGNSLPRVSTSLDNIYFWTPTIKECAGSARLSKQKSGPSALPSTSPDSSPPDGGLVLPAPKFGQTFDQPIHIPSDTESDRNYGNDDSDVEQDGGGQSDTSLDSLSTLLKKVKSPQRDTTRRASLDSLFEDTGLSRSSASPTHGQFGEESCVDGEPLTGSSSLSSAVPSIPQEHDARRSYDARSRSILRSNGPDPPPSTASASSSPSGEAEVSSQSPASSSTSEGQGLEMAIDTPRETEAVLPKHATGTPRRRSQRLRRTSPRRLKNFGGHAKTNLDTASNSDESSASTGSHDKTRSDDESYVSPDCGDNGQGASDGLDEADDESDPPPPKRRKQSRALAASRRKCRLPTLSVGLDAINSLARAATSEVARGLPSPSSSHYSSQSSPPDFPGAKFEEWPLPNAAFKRITLGDGRATFQLQFDWDPCAGSQQAGCPSGTGRRAPKSKKAAQPRGDATSSTAYTPAEDEFIINSKEQGGRTWAAIHRDFNEKFPGQRTKGSLQVRYCTKLKRRKDY